jgi:hypothetical protein
VRRSTVAVALAGLLAAVLVPPTPARAVDDYRMETEARYAVDPEGRTIEVSIEVEFTNTAPDPPGQFTVFPVVDLAVHDAASDVVAEDADGELEVATEERDGVHVATVTLREPVRFEESSNFTMAYQLADGAQDGLRVGPSLVVFPAWSFGTSGEVTIELPAAFEVRAAGDPLEAAQGDETTRLTSGEIADPTRWVALVSAYRIGQYVTLERSIPLASGTVDLRVLAFEEDAAWGERIRDLLTTALPRLEEEIGLAYERSGPLIVVESPPVGFGPIGEQMSEGSEILVAFDASSFTVLHQVAHVWIGPQLFGERWIREGLASHYAMTVAPELEAEPPYDPQERVDETREGAFPLQEWREGTPPDEAPERDGYGYAASWAVVAEVAERIGDRGLRAALARIVAGVDAYDPSAADGALPPPLVPPAPVDSQRLLDQLEVGGSSVSDLFEELVFAPDAGEELASRAEAREAYASLNEQAGEWGAPQPVRAQMADWRFDDARTAIAAASAWLEDRDELLEAINEAGLSAPQRLHHAYMRDGGGPEAQTELAAERAVVEEYQLALDAAAQERSLLVRLGLLGGSDPEGLLASANRLFAAGELHDATAAIVEARAQLATAETTGLIRLLATAALLLVLLAAAVILVRRRPQAG